MGKMAHKVGSFLSLLSIFRGACADLQSCIDQCVNSIQGITLEDFQVRQQCEAYLCHIAQCKFDACGYNSQFPVPQSESIFPDNNPIYCANLWAPVSDRNALVKYDNCCLDGCQQVYGYNPPLVDSRPCGCPHLNNAPPTPQPELSIPPTSTPQLERCTPEGQDAYQTGSEIPCCNEVPNRPALEEKLIFIDGAYRYYCVAEEGYYKPIGENIRVAISDWCDSYEAEASGGASGGIDRSIYGPKNLWDTSRVTDFSKLFNPVSEAFQIRCSCCWRRDAELQDMSCCDKFWGEDIRGWDVSSGTSFSEMFAYTNFNQDISSWDISNGQDFSRMFYGAIVFNKALCWDLELEPLSRAYLSGDMFDQTPCFGSCISERYPDC